MTWIFVATTTVFQLQQGGHEALVPQKSTPRNVKALHSPLLTWSCSFTSWSTAWGGSPSCGTSLMTPVFFVFVNVIYLDHSRPFFVNCDPSFCGRCLIENLQSSLALLQPLSTLHQQLHACLPILEKSDSSVGWFRNLETWSCCEIYSKLYIYM